MLGLFDLSVKDVIYLKASAAAAFSLSYGEGAVRVCLYDNTYLALSHSLDLSLYILAKGIKYMHLSTKSSV